MRFVFLLVLISGCASVPKEARKWKESKHSLKNEKMLAYVAETGNPNSETVVSFHGLGDIAEFPMKSNYGADEFVKKINAMGSSHVLGFGYEADSILFPSDPAWMLRPEGKGFQSVEQYVRSLQNFVSSKKLPRPLSAIGISMGGANLATVCLMHPEVFRECRLVNPMILRADQWAKFDVTDYKNPNAMPAAHFTKEEWQRFNLFVLIRKVPVKFWVTACKTDQFGLYAPTEQWVAAMRLAGNDVEFVSQENCDHFNPTLEF